MPAKSKVTEAPDLDVAELAHVLEKVSSNLKRHIADEATKRAAELGKTYAKAADERIRDNAVDLQRAQDLVRELRRQMKALEPTTERYSRIVAAVRSASWAGEDTISVKTLLNIINGPVAQATKEN